MLRGKVRDKKKNGSASFNWWEERISELLQQSRVEEVEVLLKDQVQILEAMELIENVEQVHIDEGVTVPHEE